MQRINKKKQNLYRRLSLLSELLLQTIDDLEQDNKNNALKVSEPFEKYKNDLTKMSEYILEIVFADEQLKRGTYFNELVTKIDTVIRKTEM